MAHSAAMVLPPAADGEFPLIARLAAVLPPAGADVVVGVGDDAAVLQVGGQQLCVAVDVVVDGVHVRRDLSSMADIGWKALAVNASDLAAMGATPQAAVVGLCRPAGLAADEVVELYRGLAEAAGRYGVAVVGGDTVAADQLVVSVTLLGPAPPAGAVLRSGARAGDRLVVVGALGAAAAALAADRAGLPVPADLLAAHRRPQALVRAGRILAEHGATAMVDVSDGLGADLAHVCRASGVRASLAEAALPVAGGVATVAAAAGVPAWRLACGGGEDFALVAALPAAAAEVAAAAAAAVERVPAAVVGEVLDPDAGQPLVVLTCADGAQQDLSALGYDHYAAADREAAP